MKLPRLLLIGYMTVAFAQFPGVPKLPGMGRRKKDDAAARRQQQDDGSRATAAGVPVPADSPLFEAFRKLQQQSVYHQRMAMSINDPQMAQMVAKMGFAPAETITAGDTKQVSIHMQMPILGHMEDVELRSVSRNGRLAKKWSSPASGRLMAAQDASVAKQLADAEAQYAKSIAQNIAAGPAGWISAGASSAAATAAIAQAAQLKKQGHEFWEWSCLNLPNQAEQAHNGPPPLTDLRVLGDQTLDGVAVTGYEFFVQEKGKAQGPMQLYVAKETGLPMRLAMNDPQGRGGMQMDYYGFNQGGDIEIPGCLADK